MQAVNITGMVNECISLPPSPLTTLLAERMMYMFSGRGVKRARMMIEELTMDRVGVRKPEIENFIKFLYWNGSISARMKRKLDIELMHKYEIIHDEYTAKILEDSERAYQAHCRKYGIDPQPLPSRKSRTDVV